MFTLNSKMHILISHITLVIVITLSLLSTAIAQQQTFAKTQTDNSNIPLINARLNNVVNFCLKSLPKGYVACDSQLSPAVTRICAEHAGQLIDACRDGKVAQY